MKIHIFFEEDDTNITEFTDFPTVTGSYDLNDLRKYFKHTSIDYKNPLKTRMMEALKILCAENIDLDSEVIKQRMCIKEPDYEQYTL